MNFPRKLLIKGITITALVMSLWLGLGKVVYAQPDLGLNFAATIGLGNQDPRLTAAKLIRAGLGFLGVIAVCILLYAGWTWMTARGNEEKVEKAKRILKAATIGLVIIVASFAIVSFILSQLIGATGGGGGGGVCSPPCSGGTPFCCGGTCQAGPCTIGGSSSFLVTGTAPLNGSVNKPRNTVVRYKFNENVVGSTVDDTTFVVTEGGTSVAGVRTVVGKYIEFVPDTMCPPPNDTVHCFSANATISVTAKDTVIESTSGKKLVCTLSNPCTLDFETGNYVDTGNPQVNITTRQVCAAPSNPFDASAIDDYEVSSIDFFLEGGLIDSVLNTTGIPTPFNASTTWDGSSYTVGQNVQLKATAYDIALNNASAQKTVRISASHCCNAVMDGDETGIDCGGSCLACIGAACAADSQQPAVCSDSMCASNFCTATGSTTASCTAAGFGPSVSNCCLCQTKPQINVVSPQGGYCTTDLDKACTVATEVADCGGINRCDIPTPNGESGNFVTIHGSGFGTTVGRVFFSDATGNPTIPAVLANDPILGNAACSGNVWTNNQVIAVVPVGALDGPIKIEASGGSNDRTDDGQGPLINNFKKNTVGRPGICTINPVAGRISDVITYQGIKLTASEAYFGSLSAYVKALSSTFGGPKTGTATVPNLTAGPTTTYVLQSNVYSNFLDFTKNAEASTGPLISSIEPPLGPVGQYVTIRGSGFGNSKGASSVHFGDETGPEADYNFPDVCAQSVWTDTQIIVKVPAGIALGRYNITLDHELFSPVDSSPQQFEVVAGSPNPGLCRVEPSLGQPNSAVTLWGEYFKTFSPTTSIVKFYNNKDQRGAAITFWDIDTTASGIKPWKVVTTVHVNAISGPVQVIANGQGSNGVNFGVGSCVSDSDCGTFEVCCAAGLPEAGRCKATAAQCYGNVATSVYEWQFSTGYQSSSCNSGEVQCGTACCAIGHCEDPTISKCSFCDPGFNQCTDNSCCVNPCVDDGHGGTTCAASCSGYNNNQCIEGYFCPNSPGQCSPSAGTGLPIVTGRCGDVFCNSSPECAGNLCVYNATLNRCIKTPSAANACSANDLVDGNNDPILVNNNPIAGNCGVSNISLTIPHWEITLLSSCPDGWVRGAGNKCIDIGDINGPCSICGNNETCVANGVRGVCAVGSPICTNGSTCDLTTNQCKKIDTGTCDCCCRIDHAAQDCCAGLTCGGSCGSGDPNLGVCSGCVVGGVPDDSLCNCTGTTGKFCDASSDPRGICTDCASLTDPVACSSHSECCLDAKNGNKCTSLRPGQLPVPEIVGGATLQYCGYNNCTNILGSNSCDLTPVKNGIYNNISSCMAACVNAPIPCSTSPMCTDPSCPVGTTCNMTNCTCDAPVTPPGDPCRSANPPFACLLTGCAAGYNCIDRPGDTCRCCCKPPVGPTDPDSCKLINPSLSCLADQGNCTGGQRGQCCGCSKDSECGDIATTGCGTTGSRCCSSRPLVVDHLPVPDEINVCRNASIEAVFNTRMDSATFSAGDNVQVIGDYGTDPCPNGYPIVASVEPLNRLVKWLTPLRKIAVKIAPFLLTKSAFADMSHFCVVSGSPVGSEVSATSTKVSYRLTKPLEANHRYYVVLKGDPELASFLGTPKDYYNAHITSITNVGMIGMYAGSHIPTFFNHTEFKNAEVWPFETGNEICTLDSVSVTPSFHLFQTVGEKKLLDASARSRNGQTIQGIAGVYNWDWAWNSDDNQVATVTQQLIPQVAEAVAGNKKDGQTLGKATTTITADTVNNPTSVGRVVKGSSRLRLFLCENPWPIYLTIPGYVWPWKDDITGVEFYYCRDTNGVGTSDDLPALKEAPLTGTSRRNICMSGSNIGLTCTSDSDCGGAASSCWPEVLKEFFFFREPAPQDPVITGTVDAAGGKVTINAPVITGSTKYKVYYGLSSGQYNFNKEVTITGTARNVIVDIDGLANGLNYYFVMTALSNKNQESGFSNELKLKPTDITPPASPSIKGSGADTKITLFWDPVPEAVSYIAYMGVEPRSGMSYVYPISKTTRSIPGPNQPNVTFNGLDNTGTYYLAVKSVDQYGNLSPYSAEISVKPNTPYLVSARPEVGASTGVRLKWLPFVGAQQYTISYVSTTILRPVTIDVSNSTFDYLVTSLTPGTSYTFKIIAKRANGQNSDDSNTITAIAP